jgi:transcriptional regulator with PAS, ATPase and Fis domain
LPVAADEVAGDPLRYPPQLVVGASPAFQELLATLRPAVVHGDTFLVLGETGTGKELVARLIHASKPGAAGPFVACNVAALPPDLLEAELFGIGDRVATGVGARSGLFEQAQGGSIFLDEIGELPPALQAKMLRVLQEREVHPTGRGAPRSLSLRVIAATNQDLRQRVADGAFRADLYYRLERVVCQVPSLRQRREDIPSLALALVDGYARAIGKRLGGVRGDLLARVASLDWPGNVRQLENVLQEAVRRCPTGAILDHQHLRPGLDVEARLTAAEVASVLTRAVDLPTGDVGAPVASWSERHDELERDEVRAALTAAGGVFKRAAEILGLSAHGLRLKRRRLGMG